MGVLFLSSGTGLCGDRMTLSRPKYMPSTGLSSHIHFSALRELTKLSSDIALLGFYMDHGQL